MFKFFSSTKKFALVIKELCQYTQTIYFRHSQKCEQKAYQKTFNTISFQQPHGGPYLQRYPAQPNPPLQIPPPQKSTYLPEFLASMVWEFFFFKKKAPRASYLQFNCHCQLIGTGTGTWTWTGTSGDPQMLETSIYLKNHVSGSSQVQETY